MDKELKELLYSILHELREIYICNSVMSTTVDACFDILDKHDDEDITFDKVDK